MTVCRETCLKSIYSRIVEDQSCLITLNGIEGSGKTTMLKQLQEYLELQGVQLQFISITVTNGSTITDLLYELIQEKGLMTSAAGGRGELWFIHYALSLIKDSSKELCLICFDDAHLLPEENLRDLRKLLNSESILENMVVIFAGQSIASDKNAIELGEFTAEEGSKYLHQRIDAAWHPIYTRQHDWILENSGYNPRKLSGLVDKLIRDGKLTKEGFITHYDDLVQSNSIEINTSSYHEDLVSELREIELLKEKAAQLSKAGLFRSALNVYEKLYRTNGGKEYLLLVGKMQFELRQCAKAQKIFDELSLLNEYKDNPSIHYHLGQIFHLTGRLEKAKTHYLKVEQNLSIDDLKSIKIRKNIIRFFIHAGDTKAYKTRYASFKESYGQSKHFRFEYLDLVCSLYDRITLEQDTEKLAREGIRLAKKKKDRVRERGFTHTLICYHERKGELQQALNLFRQIEREYAHDYLFENDAYHLALKGRILFQLGLCHKAYRTYKQASRIFRLLCEPAPYFDCLQAIMSMEGLVGNIKEMKATQAYLKAGIKGLSKASALLPFFTLACSCKLIGKKTESIKILDQLRKQVVAMDDELMLAHINSAAAPMVFPVDKDTALKYWESSRDFLTRNNLTAFLPVVYFNMCWALVEANDTDLLRKLTSQWLTQFPDTERSFHYLYIKTAEEILTGKISSGLTRVSLLEKSFDGSLLWEWHKLYEWLSRQPIKPADRTKYRLRAMLTKTICLKTPIDGDAINGVTENAFDQLLLEWAYVVLNDSSMSLEVVEDCFQEEEKIKAFQENLKFWDMDCVESTIIHPQTTNDTPIIINLLGSPELYFNNHKLSSKDWTSRKALEILTYIILKSRKNKKAIEFNDLIHDLWTPRENKMDSARLVRNNMLTRLRKIFNGFDTPMLISTRDDIRFNWESGLYRLDIDLFESTVKRLKANHENTEIALQTMNQLYRGALAEGFDGLWIESERQYFQDQFETFVQP